MQIKNWVRSRVIWLLDRLTVKNGIRISLHDLEIRVPGRFYGYYPRDYEKENFAFYQQAITPGMVCLDIGAHIGVVAVYMAKKCRAKVKSFEPTPLVYSTLEKLVRINKVENQVTLFPFAVSKISGKQSFYVNTSLQKGVNPDRIAESNSLVPADFGSTIRKDIIETQTISIDDFREQHKLKIGFIKLDAEGAEKDILIGAAETMLRDRPSGVVSVHNFTFPNIRGELEEIWELMERYQMKIISRNGIVSREEFIARTEEEIFDFQFSPK